MELAVLVNLVSVALLLLFSEGDAYRQDGICSSMLYENSDCLLSDFLCADGSCIPRTSYCDGKRDCKDGSDEEFCSVPGFHGCPTYLTMERCAGSIKCIPRGWFCDGVEDCSDGSDEYCDEIKNDDYAVRTKAVNWLKTQKKPQPSTDAWGPSVDKLAVVLYLSGEDESIRKEMAYELSILLLSRLTQMKLSDIPSHDLASYVNAFLVTCLNPRKFHGLDIVQELRSRVDALNYTNPYLLLTLCNAGDTITELDKMKLMDVFWIKRRAFWTDIRALVVMALACANRQSANEAESDDLQDLTMELKLHLYANGSVENVQTTALVMQALLSAESESDPDIFDETRALRYLKAMQKADGSFGSFLNTYYVLPVLNCWSLADVGPHRCRSYEKEETSTTLESLASIRGPKIRVQYSIWIGSECDLERNLVLRVPPGMSFYRIMEIAADSDPRYRFHYVVQDGKPYVNALSGLQDDPEKGHFWFLFTVEEGKAPFLSEESPADVIPEDNEHFVMWYRSGTWVDALSSPGPARNPGDATNPGRFENSYQVGKYFLQDSP